MLIHFLYQEIPRMILKVMSKSDVDCVDDDGEHVRNIFDVIDDM